LHFLSAKHESKEWFIKQLLSSKMIGFKNLKFPRNFLENCRNFPFFWKMPIICGGDCLIEQISVIEINLHLPERRPPKIPREALSGCPPGQEIRECRGILESRNSKIVKEFIQ